MGTHAPAVVGCSEMVTEASLIERPAWCAPRRTSAGRAVSAGSVAQDAWAFQAEPWPPPQ